MCSLDIYDQGLMLQSINPWSYTSKEHMVRHPLLLTVTLILGHIYLKNTWLGTLFYRL
jgi:hypothetical protein